MRGGPKNSEKKARETISTEGKENKQNIIKNVKNANKSNTHSIRCNASYFLYLL